MKVEVDIPNADHQLVPGMYGQVRFKIRRERPSITLPTSALVFSTEGMRVAVLDGNHVRFRRVVVGRDFGSEAEIASGVTADEQVVTNPGEHLTDGIEVQVNAPPRERTASAGNATGAQKLATQGAAR
jgi:multidrug efflux pump subunit AcrA (membrane-fusion protein)